MDYKKIYYQIIDNAKKSDRSKKHGYYEKHHILPKSLGGDNKKTNLVLLTAREHFICHVLLVKIYKGHTLHYKKMLHALMLMKGCTNNQNRYINSNLYEKFKEDYRKIRISARRGVLLTDDHKDKISKSLMGHVVSEETKKLISEKAKSRKRKPFSDEYKKRHSEIMKQKHRWKNKAQ